MINLLRSGVVILLLLSGCGFDGTPTRQNDFVPLTSIKVEAVSTEIEASHTIAKLTSTQLKATGDYSGQFTRDITDQVDWSSASPAVADFKYNAPPNWSRVSGLAPGNAVLTATMGTISSPGFTMTVSNATIASLEIIPANPSVPKGLSTQFTATGTFSDATKQDITFDSVWVSSVPTVATISNDPAGKGLARAIAVGMSTISATFDSKSADTTMEVTVPQLLSIAVMPANPSILSISNLSFTAIGTYSDGTTPDITSLVSWKSSDTSYASISSGGAAKTLAPGTATISATLGVSGTSNLKVTGGRLNVGGIVITPASPRLAKGTTTRITATGSFSNGTTRDITGAVDWTVADTAKATAINAGGNLAWLNALATTPSTNITATSGEIYNTTTLAVVSPVLQSITINPTSLVDLPVGTSGRFTVTANFTDSTTQDVTYSADWSSNDSAVATVGTTGLAKGRVSAISAGSATISATYGDKTVKASVSVKYLSLQSLTISTLLTSYTSGAQVMYTTTASYTNGTSKDVTEDTTWVIDKPYVAILADSLNQSGQVVAVDSGTATLTATFGGKSPTVKITVP